MYNTRYDPESNIFAQIEFESDRVDFLVSAEAILASKTKIKLNTKKLYSADGRAVQELLKLATLLYR